MKITWEKISYTCSKTFNKSQINPKKFLKNPLKRDIQCCKRLGRADQMEGISHWIRKLFHDIQIISLRSWQRRNIVAFFWTSCKLVCMQYELWREQMQYLSVKNRDCEKCWFDSNVWAFRFPHKTSKGKLEIQKWRSYKTSKKSRKEAAKAGRKTRLLITIKKNLLIFPFKSIREIVQSQGHDSYGQRIFPIIPLRFNSGRLSNWFFKHSFAYFLNFSFFYNVMKVELSSGYWLFPNHEEVQQTLLIFLLILESSNCITFIL